MLELAIVIVNYNVCDLLRDCLRSVYASTGITLDVCVVDNASHDGSPDRVRSQFPRAELILKGAEPNGRVNLINPKKTLELAGVGAP